MSGKVSIAFYDERDVRAVWDATRNVWRVLPVLLVLPTR